MKAWIKKIVFEYFFWLYDKVITVDNFGKMEKKIVSLFSKTMSFFPFFKKGIVFYPCNCCGDLYIMTWYRQFLFLECSAVKARKKCNYCTESGCTVNSECTAFNNQKTSDERVLAVIWIAERIHWVLSKYGFCVCNLTYDSLHAVELLEMKLPIKLFCTVADFNFKELKMDIVKENKLLNLFITKEGIVMKARAFNDIMKVSPKFINSKKARALIPSPFIGKERLEEVKTALKLGNAEWLKSFKNGIKLPWMILPEFPMLIK